jgi:colicin import membrane protein
MVAPEKPVPSAPSAKSSQFAVSVRGYNQRQVDERLAELAGELKQTARNRDEAVATSGELSKALGYAQKELTETKAALVRMSSSPSGAGAMAERVRMMMQLAEEEIADLKAAAEADAASARAEADKYAHETQRATEKAAKDAQAEREKLLADAKAEIERLDAEAAQKRKELDMESVRTRAAADKKAEEASAARRAEAERASAEKIAEADRVSAEKRAEAERISAEKIAKAEKSSAEEIAAKQEQVSEALADAKNQQTEAQQTRKLSLELRAKVAERLSATDVAVQEAIRLLAPNPENAEAPALKAEPVSKPSPSKSNGPRPSAS